MNNIQVFENEEFGNVRTTKINEKPYFVGTDVAKALGYSNPRDALSRHCKGVVKRDTLTSRGVQRLSYINEGDLYRLIIKSKLPSAEKFELWVFEEVLPSIRRNGAYIRNQENMTPEQIMAAGLEAAKKIIENKDKEINRMKPKEVFADAVATSKTSILVGELAKILKQNGADIGQNKLFAWMREKGYLIKRKGSDYNMPTQKSMEMGLFEIKETSITKPDGSTHISKTTKVTGKGQIYFTNKFAAKDKEAKSLPA